MWTFKYYHIYWLVSLSGSGRESYILLRTSRTLVLPNCWRSSNRQALYSAFRSHPNGTLPDSTHSDTQPRHLYGLFPRRHRKPQGLVWPIIPNCWLMLERQCGSTKGCKVESDSKTINVNLLTMASKPCSFQLGILFLTSNDLRHPQIDNVVNMLKNDYVGKQIGLWKMVDSYGPQHVGRIVLN